MFGMGFAALFRKGYQNNTPVLLAAHPIHISLLHQSVDRNGKGAGGHRQCLCHRCHVLGFPHINGLYDMHVINTQILIFTCFQRLFFDGSNIAEKPDQYLIQGGCDIHSVHLSIHYPHRDFLSELYIGSLYHKKQILCTFIDKSSLKSYDGIVLKYRLFAKEGYDMDQLIFSLNATIPVFLVMVIGYLLKQIHIVDEPFVKTLNSFNFKVTLPLLGFRDISGSDIYSVWDTRYVLYCFLVTLTCITLIWAGAGLLYKDKAQLGEFVQASYRSSAAVLGIAFIQNIYGSSGMAPLMIIGTVPLYNVAAVLILSFTGPNAHGLDKASLKASLKGIVTNPIILGIVFGILASACRFHFPTIIDKALGSVASLATPLALIGLGAGFEGKKALKQLLPTSIAGLIKLVLLPILFLPLAIRMGFTQEKLVAILIMLGSPTTVSCYIMAKNMGHEGTLTSSTIVATTFFSSITITAFLFVLRGMGLV